MRAFQARYARSLVDAALVLTLSSFGLSACMTIQNESPFDEVGKQAQGQGFVEGFIEYGAPQNRLVGPQPFLLHVSARQSGPVEVEVSPSSLDPAQREAAPPTVKARALSSVVPATEVVGSPMSAETARVRLAALAHAIEQPAPRFEGCLSPVRVRLVRADGALVEKEGCRASQGWPRAVSEAVSAFMDSATRSGVEANAR